MSSHTTSSSPIDDDERMLTAAEVTPLLRRLCIEHGFCLSAEVAEKFESNPPRTVETFTRAVFVAEGLDPAQADRRLFAQVREVVATAFKGTAQNGV
jgi:hypothetical protein